MDAAKVDEPIHEDLRLGDMSTDRNLDAAHDVGLDCHDSMDVLDYARDPVFLYPCRGRD